MTIAERLELFEQVCQAIQHAHHKGVIHRDLKPGNVLVSTHDAKPFSKVIDFGIAKAIAQRLTDETLFTAHDQFLGTPQYMSPEQAEGSVDIDTRTDVYSLGVLLYELLTGSTPFSSTELRAAAFEHLKKQIIEVDPPKPSTRLSLHQPTLSTLAASRRTEPKRLGALVRGELDWIVMKALEKDRKRRYETPASLARDIMAHLEGEAVEAAPPSTAYRLHKFVKRHRAGILAASAVGGALLAGAVGTTWGYLRAEQTSKLEQMAREEADKQHAAAELEAYIANIALAQIAMANASWPEARVRLAACPESCRGWEWHFLQQQAGSIVGELPKPASNARFDPTGRYVLTVHPDWMARLWDLEGSQVGQSMSQEFQIKKAYFLGDGTRIVTIDDQRTARVRNLQGQVSGLGFFEQDADAPPPIQSPDGSSLLTKPDPSNLVRLLDLEGRRLGKPISLDQSFTAMFSANGSEILTANTMGEVVLQRWSLTGEPLGEPISLAGSGQFAAFSPLATSLLTIDKDHTVRLWDLAGQPIGQPLRHDSLVSSAVYCGDGTRLMTQSDAVRVWDLRGNLLFTADSKHDVSYFAYIADDAGQISHDGKQLFFPNEMGASVWDSETGVHGRISLPKGTHGYYSMKCELSRDGKHVLISTAETPSNTLIADADNMVMAIDFLEGKRDLPLEIAAAMDDNVRDTQALPDAETNFPWKASLDDQRRLRVTDRQTGQSVPKFAGDKSPVTTFAVSPDGERLVTGDERTVWFYDTATWREVAAIRQGIPVKELSFTPDGTRLVVQFSIGTAQIWDTGPQAEQRKTWAARHAAQRPAQEYVRKLLAGPLPEVDLPQVVRNDPSLSALQKVVTLAMVHFQLEEIKTAVESDLDVDTAERLQIRRNRMALLEPTGDPLKDRIHRKILEQVDQWYKANKESQKLPDD